MKHLITRLSTISLLSLVVVLGACGKSTSGLLQNSEAKSSNGWSMKVIDASQPGTVNVKARSIYGGTEPEKAEGPPANQKWILLSTELTPPAGGAALPVKQIKLVDGASNYQALAIAGVPDKGSPAFVYLKDSVGLAQVNEAAQLLWAILKNQSTGDAEIVFQKAGGEKAFVLFAVPAGAKNLTLQLSP